MVEANKEKKVTKLTLVADNKPEYGFDLFAEDRYENAIFTVGELYDFQGDSKTAINLRPLHQRPDLGDIRKKQEIILELLEGRSIGLITINKVTGDVHYRYESLDGGHRKRAIIEFIECEFALPDGRTFADLIEIEQNIFLGKRIMFVIYDNLTNREKGKVFRSLNKSDKTTAQEVRNSYGDTPLANYVRDTVRGERYFFDKLAFENKRLINEELFVRMIVMLRGKVPLDTPAEDTELDALYDLEMTEKEVDAIDKLVKPLNKFITNIYNTRKNYTGDTSTKSLKLSKRELIVWQRLYCYFVEKFGPKFTIAPDKLEDLWLAVDEVLANVLASGKDLQKRFTATNRTSEGIPVLDSTKTITETFRSCIGIWKGSRDYRYIIQVFEAEGIDFADYVTEGFNTSRSFSVSTKKRKLTLQRYRCKVDGLKLIFTEAEGGHINPDAAGASSDPDNCVMIRTRWNQDMSDMHYDDYMILWNKANEGKSEDEFVNVNKLKNK